MHIYHIMARNLSVGGSEGRLTTSPQCVTASHSGSVVDTSPSAVAPTSAAAAAAAVCNVMSWSANDVARWLHHNDLDLLADRFLSAYYIHLTAFFPGQPG